MPSAKDERKFIVLLSLAGILSAWVTISHAFLAQQSDPLFSPGIAYGVIISGCFVVLGALRRVSKIILFIAASAAANLLAVWVGLFLARTISWVPWSMGEGIFVSPVALFIGGLFGAVIVVSSAVTCLHPEIKLSDLGWKVFCWSALGGVLGIVGWQLGPILGIHLWSLMHFLYPTKSTESFQSALSSETSRLYSLWLVWQTGVAAIMGIVLRRYEVQSGSKEAKQR